MNTNPQPTCAERVASASENRLESIRCMLDPQIDDFELYDDGTLDTVITCDGEEIARYSDTAGYRTDDGVLDLELLVNCESLRETMYERFHEHGLEFSWCDGEQGNSGYFRFLLSYGGPSEEIRFYLDAAKACYRIEFWFLDWFDGASKDITHDERAKLLQQTFSEWGMFDKAEA